MFHAESSSRNAPASGIDLLDSTQPMGILDLNEESFDLNEQAGLLLPNYFTHLLMEEAIDETPELQVDTDAPAVHVHTVPTDSEIGQFVAGTNTTSLVQDDADDNEASSQQMDPHIEMCYDTLQGAKEHYNAYAARIGFSIKVNRNRKSARTNELAKQQFVCNKFNKPRNDDGRGDKPDVVGPIPSSESSDEEDWQNAELASLVAGIAKQKGQKKNPKKRKMETIIPTNCKAEMVVKLKDGRWEVIAFTAEHNHPLVHKPSLNKYLRSHQGIPVEEKDFVKNLHSTNLTAGRMMDIMSKFYGSELLAPYTAKIITNYCATLTAEETKDGDMTNHFQEQKEKDSDFYFRLDCDEEDRVKNIFWVDGPARRAYAEAYHDCVSFDNTYLTKKYNMPFAPFIGINKHGQSIMLGCGFVRQELATSFDWLFESFLVAMNGPAPDNMITDQDVAMKMSIDRMFLATIHRFCRWHIMQKS